MKRRTAPNRRRAIAAPTAPTESRTDGADRSESPQQGERRSRGSRLRRGLKAFIGPAPATFLAFLTGLVALLYTVSPSLRPDPRDTLKGTVEIVGVERAVFRNTWRQRLAGFDRREYARILRLDNLATDYPADDPCGVGEAPGYQVSVATEATGYKRRELSLQAAVLTARTDTRVDVGQFAGQASVPIDAPTARSVQRLHLLAGNESGDIYVRVELFDGDGNLLGVADSKVFRALNPRELAADPPKCGPPEDGPPPDAPG